MSTTARSQPDAALRADTPHREQIAQKYLGRPSEERRGTALCLSGGGYRAALFHLGALRRLNELGVLSKIDTLSSVSGGSILAAFLAQTLRPWPAPGEVLGTEGWDATVASPFRSFTKKNIRTLWFFRRILPWNWPRSTVAVEQLEKRLRKDIAQLRLSELPECPRFIFCATDMAFGANWQFERDQVGDYQAGYRKPPPADWTVARAAAASACFPPAFDPQPMALEPQQLICGDAQDYPGRAGLIRGLRLTDGGVYDNMALEPVWDDHHTVLVSDAGATLDFRPDPHWMVKRIFRYQTLQGWQASAVRKRWLISRFINERPMGAFWGVGSTVEHYEHHNEGYGEGLVDEVISEIRTDLDYFTDAEAGILENHGYELADAALMSHPANLSPASAPFSLPHDEWPTEDAVRKALKGTNKRRIPFGRWRLLHR